MTINKSATELRAELNAEFGDSFMRPDIQEADYWEIETDDGSSCVVPVAVCGSLLHGLEAGARLDADDNEDLPTNIGPERLGEFFEDLKQYLPDGCGTDIESAELKKGYLARLSAPGYMDCTEWEAHATYEEAATALLDTWGSDEPKAAPASASPSI